MWTLERVNEAMDALSKKYKRPVFAPMEFFWPLTVARDKKTVMVVLRNVTEGTYDVYVDLARDGDAVAWAKACEETPMCGSEELASWTGLDPFTAQAIIAFVMSGEPLSNVL